jgi:hypothetical protein
MVFGLEISDGGTWDQRTKRWVEIKRVNKDSILDLTPPFLLAGVTTDVICKQCFQKVLVLVFQVKESNQNTWMG